MLVISEILSKPEENYRRTSISLCHAIDDLSPFLDHLEINWFENQSSDRSREDTVHTNVES